MEANVVGIKFDNQKGMTLLEVLLSIVILTIVLTSFAGFFSQSALFVKKNEEKMNTFQTAQQIVNIIEDRFTKDMVIENNLIACSELDCNTLDKNDISQLANYPINTIYDISAIFKNGEEELVQVKVIVSEPEHPENFSETFTYIRR
jgi:prepilin-type N-terminal cleavage/methylation domain-containing protein